MGPLFFQSYLSRVKFKTITGSSLSIPTSKIDLKTSRSALQRSTN